jgi:methylenetetrahydrofolate--tRNA-(uracil-5-)-methyltransferase
MGSLSSYVTRPNANFQPMNANFGLLPPITSLGTKQQRRQQYAQRAREKIFLFAKDLHN